MRVAVRAGVPGMTGPAAQEAEGVDGEAGEPGEEAPPHPANTRHRPVSGMRLRGATGLLGFKDERETSTSS